MRTSPVPARLKPALLASLFALLTACGSGKIPPTTEEPEEQPNNAPTISGSPSTGIEIDKPYTFTPAASDQDNDTLTFSITNKPGWSSFSVENGTLSGTPTLNNIGTVHNIVISVNDGNGGNISLPAFSIQVKPSALESALKTGQLGEVTVSALLDEALAELAIKKATPPLLTEMYGSEPISYTPGNRTQLLSIDSYAENAFPVLMGNQGNTLAMAGTTNTSRYAAFGMSPTELFQEGESLSYEAPFNRLLAWLINGQATNTASLNDELSIALSFASNDHSNITEWIADNHAKWIIKDCNTVADLQSCYSTADLIITGWRAEDADAAAIRQALSESMNDGKPVLYTHSWYEAYNDVAHAIADLLHFSLQYGGNYWAKDAAVWTNLQDMQASIWEKQGLGSVDTLLKHLKAEDYAFDWASCIGENCNDVSGLSTEFQLGANAVRTIMNELDTNKIKLFNSTSLRLHKLLALLGDKFRQDIRFPMDKVTTNDNTLLKAYFADHAVYNYRSINPAQADMGNFSRSDFSHLTPTSRTVNLISKQNFRSTGAYALPGQTVRVTRTGKSNLTVKVFINSLRSGSTHQWEKDGYTRPKYLQSPHIEIASGETIELTSPYGGPIQLEFSANDLPVTVRFENVGEHPYWASNEDNESFTEKLNAGEYDWAELVTPGFEVHSTLSKMRESIGIWQTAPLLAAATMKYTHNFPHVLAGFQGPGIDVVPEIHDFASTNGWTIDPLDLVKHMNADQATCGYGCSGNPYDAYWAFSPIGHGDIHELGHGLEKARFKFEGWEGHAVTNPYSYYTKSQYYQQTGNQPDCQSLPFKDVFDALQASLKQTDPATYLQTNLWEDANWSQQVSMTIQMMMTTQYMGKLDNGWHQLARLHMLEREFTLAKASEAIWDTKKDALGFSGYTLAEAKTISNNDWLVIAHSYVSGLDYRDYIKLWGYRFSDKADAQVVGFAYPAAPRRYFVSSGTGYCKGEGFDGTSVLLDGVQKWP